MENPGGLVCGGAALTLPTKSPAGPSGVQLDSVACITPYFPGKEEGLAPLASLRRARTTNGTIETLIVAFCVWMHAIAPAAEVNVPIRILVSSQAQPLERLAAQELAGYLQKIYPREKFTPDEPLPEAGPCILVGSVLSDARLQGYLGNESLTAPESFRVFTMDQGPRRLGIIAGADARGVVYGVYALLESLGCGFYLSGEAMPAAKRESFSFNGWQLEDRPLVRDRLVFDWYNFLSGCSTWNLEHWQAWIRQSQKMGYNAIMVHAYGNNPMVSFTFNGQAKPVGYLSTTRKGRDWSTPHVNDVRRLWGGEVFDKPVFGADAAMAPDEERSGAAEQLMRQVFASAAERSLDVYFAVDIDTISANPQALINTLPPAARFATDNGKVWLANPDTPEGYRYYQAQVEALLKAYPQITWLVAWFRNGATPWMELKVSEMPVPWQEEYQAELARTPGAAGFWRAPQMFALGKIVRAFDRALRDLGREDVKLAAGTWAFNFLAPADRFFPASLKLIGLDYNVLHGRSDLSDAPLRQNLREVGEHRPVIPVIWAHHDDGHYLGRPYTPYSEFYTKLTDAKACGFGIIHWTTRPLDLFFTSHAKQVWQSTKNQPLRMTCDAVADKAFGQSARPMMGGYLERWITHAPMFARETSDFFMDRPITNLEQVIAGCRERLKLIDAAPQPGMMAAQRDRLNYFKGLEEFMIAFHQAQSLLQRSQALLKSGDIIGARATMAECHPEHVIEGFAQFTALDGLTRGEQGLVVSMNLRWLPHFLRHRQMLGLDPVRCHFGPTSHDLLAQARGTFTFHFDSDRQIWQTLGTVETGSPIFILPSDAKVAGNSMIPEAWEELCRNGLESDKPIQLSLRPCLSGVGRGATGMPPGEYRLRLLMLDSTSTAPGQRVFDISITGAAVIENDTGASGPPPLNDRVDIFKLTGQASRILARHYRVALGPSGAIAIALKPIQGKAVLCGAVLEPLALK